MILKVIKLLLFLLFSAQLFAQSKKDSDTLMWLTPAKAQELMTNDEKPLIIDVYTDWCHYCKIMDKTTWRYPPLKAYVSQYFFPIKFNAESKQDIQWQGQNYIYKQANKVHMLAAEWLKGNMVFPSTVIIPKNGESVILPGVISPKELEPILHYFGEGHYKTKTWESFKENYKIKWK